MPVMAIVIIMRFRENACGCLLQGAGSLSGALASLQLRTFNGIKNTCGNQKKKSFKIFTV